MQPTISIIIPTYNSGKTLKSCIASIVNQSFEDWEVVIFDNLSTDDTLKIAQSFKDIRITIISKKDKGVYDAMNAGITQAKGEWLYFLGSDDTLYNDNVLLKVHEECSSTNANIIYGSVLIKGNTHWAKEGEIYDGEFNLNKLLQKGICHQAIFYKRSVFEKVGPYNLTYNVLADYDLNLRAAAFFEMKYLDMIIAIFNVNGLSSKGVDDPFYVHFNENVLKYFKNKNLVSVLHFSEIMIRYGKEQIRLGNFCKGLFFLNKGFFYKILNKLKASIFLN